MSNELAEEARKLMQQSGSGAIATHSVVQPDYPFVSVAPYAVSSSGQCLFLFSHLSTHSKNLRSNNKSSLLITNDDGDLAGARLTIVGDVVPVPDEEVAESHRVYVNRHPAAEQWAGFGDFAFYTLVPKAYYYVAGFGKMGWIKPKEFDDPTR